MFELLKVGHVLRTADGDIGRVVAVIERGEFACEFEQGWAYLEAGVLIEFDEKGLVHYPTAVSLLNEFLLNPPLASADELRSLRPS